MATAGTLTRRVLAARLEFAQKRRGTDAPLAAAADAAIRRSHQRVELASRCEAAVAGLSLMGYNSRMFKVLTTPQFDKWLDGLRDPVGSAAINLRIERAKLGNLGQWRAVGDGVNEMKIDVGPGYRAYFVRRGKIIVVVLCGGDKSTQKKDIKLAKQIAGELED